MYLDKEQEEERDRENFWYNINYYLGTGCLFGLLFHLGWWISFGDQPYWWITVPIILLIAMNFYTATWKEGRAFRHVPGNWVFMTIPPDAEKDEDGKYTEFIEYTAGLHYSKITEEDGPKVSLGKDMEVEFEVKVSTKDDDIFIKGKAFLRADSKRLVQFVRTGDTPKERQENVVNAFDGVIKNYIEIICSAEEAEDVVGAKRKEIIKKISGIWRGDKMDAYEEEFGVQAGILIISDIDFDPEMSKKRRLKKMAKYDRDAVEVFIKNENENKSDLDRQFDTMGAKDIMAHLRVTSDKSKGKDIFIHGLEDAAKILKGIRSVIPK